MDANDLMEKSQDQINTMIENILKYSSPHTPSGEFRMMNSDDFNLLIDIISLDLMNKKYNLQIIKHLQDYMLLSTRLMLHSKHTSQEFSKAINHIMRLIKQKG